MESRSCRSSSRKVCSAWMPDSVSVHKRPIDSVGGKCSTLRRATKGSTLYYFSLARHHLVFGEPLLVWAARYRPSVFYSAIPQVEWDYVKRSQVSLLLQQDN